MENEDYGRFLQSAIHILSTRKNPRVMILVDNAPGLEMITNTGYSVDQLGILEASKIMVTDQMRENRNREMEQRVLAESQRSLDEMEKARKGGAN